MKRQLPPVVAVLVMIAALAAVVWPTFTKPEPTGLEPERLNARPARTAADGEPLRLALRDEVRAGDSLASVWAKIGIGEQATGDDRRAIMDAVRALAPRSVSYPDGLREGDAFYGFPAPVGMLYLQFRDGRLVNHVPGEYADEGVFGPKSVRP